MNKRVKRIFAALICILVVVPLLAASVLAEEEEPAYGLTPALVSGNAVAVYSIESGQMLYSKRGDEIIAPSAITKLVTMMVAYDIFTEYNLKLDQTDIPVTADSNAVIGPAGDKSAPRIGLTPGDIFTAETMIAASLVGNSNDACSAVAFYCAQLLGTGIEGFIAKMNDKTAEIGAENTHLRNVVGLDSTGMETTPEDAAKIAAAFYRYNDLFALSNQPYVKVGGATVHAKNYLLSNSLIRGYNTADAKGIIAGQRNDSEGYFVATAVESEGLAYIIIVMDAPGEIRNTDGTREFPQNNAYEDMKILIPWTKNAFGYKTLSEPGEIIGELYVGNGKGYDYVTVVTEGKLEKLINKAADMDRVERRIVYGDKVYESDKDGTKVNTVDAPISKGQKLGELFFSLDGEELGSLSLIAQTSIDSSGLIKTATGIKAFLFGGTMKTIIIVIVGVIALYILFSITMAILRGVRRIKKGGDRRKNAQKKPPSDFGSGSNGNTRI